MIRQYDTIYKGLGEKYPVLRGSAAKILFKTTVMLVDVVPLRWQGRKIDRASVRAAVPVRGSLQIEACSALLRSDDRVTPRIALLVQPGRAESALPVLLYARVGRLRSWQLVVVGREDRGDSRQPVKPGPLQAWWCRVVRDPPGVGLVASARVDAPAPPRVGQVEHA